MPGAREVHLLLTDRLNCPRCGSGFGLILLADRLTDRRVLEGALGCPNCRDRFPITNGFADLRTPPRTDLPEVIPVGPADAGEVERIATLLGVVEGPGNIALTGSLTRYAGLLADRMPGVEVIAIAEQVRGDAERAGVSRMVSGVELPFHPGSLRALALAEGKVEHLERPETLVRSVMEGGRIVIERPDSDAGERLANIGAQVLVRDERWLVAMCRAA